MSPYLAGIKSQKYNKRYLKGTLWSQNAIRHSVLICYIGLSSHSLRIVVLLTYICFIVIGCLVAIYLNDFIGRKFSLVITGLISIVGVLIEATSATGGTGRFSQFVVGKVIASIAMGLAVSIVPLYLSETSTASARGFAVSIYQNVQILGLILASGVVYASVKSTTSSAYLIPICIQFIAPTIMAFACPFLPESPRWLIRKG